VAFFVILWKITNFAVVFREVEVNLVEMTIPAPGCSRAADLFFFIFEIYFSTQNQQ
jgi:hypothetical protein